MSKSLTACLKSIGDEQTSITINGKTHTCTKTEAVARKLFLLAQGGTEKIIDEDGNEVTIVHKADSKVAKMVREFVDGKPNVEPPKKTKGKAKAGRFDSEVAGRLSDRLGPSSALLSPQRPRPVSKGIQT